MWNKISRIYPPWLEIIPLFFVLFAGFYTAIHYNELPAMFPQHFGPNGKPDAWSAKSYVSVYLLPTISFMVYLSMVFINFFLIIRPADPRQVVNLTEKEKDALGPARLEEIRITTARGLWLTNLVTMAMLAYLAYAQVNVALGRQSGLGWIMWVFLLLIMVASIGLAIKVMKLSRPAKKRRRK